MDVEGYSYDRAMNILNLSNTLRSKFNLMNEESLRDYSRNKCKILYDNNKLKIRGDDKCIIFIFTSQGKPDAAIAFRKY